MFDNAAVDELDRASCAQALEEAVTARRRAEAWQLVLVAHWADLHPPCSPNQPIGPRAVTVGAEGTPQVTEFATTELGLLLEVSTITATVLLRDVLDLRHRLPRTWAAICAGRLDGWKGRQVARATSRLTADRARWVDAEVLPALLGLPYGRAMTVVAGTVVAADPAAAEEHRRAEATRRYVTTGRAGAAAGGGVHGDGSGLQTFIARTTVADVARLMDMVNHLADRLPSPTPDAITGDADTADVRRARALGVLADPARACLLLARAHAPGDHDLPPRVADAAAWGRAVLEGGPQALDRLRPRTVLYVHLAEQTLRTPDCAQVARTEGLGPLTVDQLKEWLGTDHVDVRPVLDLADQRPVDAYELPARLREAVTVRQPFEVFPWGTQAARRADVDHTVPYRRGGPRDTGPPGQTRLDNLGPLGRTHHRAKTHGGFACHQPRAGLYLWSTPSGRYFQVDHTGTRRLTPLTRVETALTELVVEVELAA